MLRGERVDLVRKLADRLSDEDYPWDDMDLVLGEFGCPTSDYEHWHESQRSYALHHLQQGSDEILVELDEYLFGGSSRTMLDPADLPWEAGAVRLFLSHTSTNATLAGELREILRKWRVDVFVAHTTIEPSREWELTIEGALASCHALAALITNDFQASAWCDQEVGYCLARKVPIVPVKLDANPHGFIAKYQAAPVAGPRSAFSIADAIFRTLARHRAVRNLMAGPVVCRYSGSGSFDGARNNFALLRGIPDEAWTRELVEIVERAPNNNNQIQHAVVLEPENKPMPEAAAELLAPHRERLGMNVPLPSPDADIPF